MADIVSGVSSIFNLFGITLLSEHSSLSFGFKVVELKLVSSSYLLQDKAQDANVGHDKIFNKSIARRTYSANHIP